MKKTVICFFSLFFALFLLLSSIGISLNKMECLSSGKVKFSMLKIKHCGPTESNNDCDSSFDTKCCDITSSFVHVDISSVVHYSFIKISNVESLFTGYVSGIFKIEHVLPIASLFYSDLPPPLQTKDFLNFIQILRI